MKRGVWAIAGLVLLACSSWASAQDFLSKSEIKNLYSGLTIDGTSRRGGAMTHYFRGDGSLLIDIARRGGHLMLETKWRVTDDAAVCWESFGDRQFCNKVKKAGEGYEFYGRGGQKIPGFWKPRL